MTKTSTTSPKTTSSKSKTSPKKVLKKPAKKVASKTSPKTKKVPAKKVPAKKGSKSSDGPNKPQVRVLEFLAKQTRSQTRQQISVGANVDTAMLSCYIGSDNLEIREKNDKIYGKSLLTLGLVKVAPPEDESVRGICYEINAAGRKAIS